MPDFMPHGYCFQWYPLVLWLHVISDGLITLSYYCIPVVLIYFIRKNRDVPFNRIFWMFGAFILACGTTHLMEIWNVWHGNYLLAGVIKAITAVVSVITAAMLVPLVPQAMSVPGRVHLLEVNRKLEHQLSERKKLDAPINAPLRRKVTAGFIVAVLLTIFLGLASWRGSRRAEEDAYWVSHTHEVMEAVQRTTRHAIEVVTSARAFSLSGQEPLLAHYEANRDAVHRDEATVRQLTADNPGQQQRIGQMEWQVGAALQFADAIVAQRRKTGDYPGTYDALESERLLDVVRATTHDMYAEEVRLLAQRTETARAGRESTKVIAVLGVFLSVVLWLLARLAVNREINISQRARSELSILNNELEQRVEQRTAALQSEVVERMRMEESRERLAAVVESSDDAIITKTLEGVITSWNRGAEKIFGYPAADVVGRPMLMLFPTERASEESDILTRIRKGEGMEHFETVRVRSDGKRIEVSETISPIRDRSGAIVGASKIARDITAHKHAEVALAGQAEQLFRQAAELARSRDALETQSRMLTLVLESVGEGLVAANLEGHFLIWNDSASKLLGRGPAELSTEQWTPHYECFLPDGITPVPTDCLPLVRALHGESLQMELIVRHPGSEQGVFLDFTGRPMKDDQGRVCGGVVAFRDITERKRAEAVLAQQSAELLGSQQALEAQTLMLQSVLDSISEGLVAADETGKFILWNPAAARIVGLGAANIPPEQWTDHYGTFLPDTVTPFPPRQNPLLRAMRGESCTAEMYVRNAELETGVWIESSASPLKGKDGVLRGGVVAFRDITQRKTDEREIHKLNDELEARVVERTAALQVANQELEAFTYSVSHDLRAPLRHISGFSKILLEDFAPSLPAEAQHHLQRIVQGAARMGTLVDELLNLARVGRQSLAVQPTGLSSIVQDVLVMLDPEIVGRNVEWKIADLPVLECDPTLVRQVFQNLLHNALKYSRPRSPAMIEIGQTEKYGLPVIFVRDNGVGFSMKYADKLFGVFQRLHRAEEFEGTGVGLATVQRIVHKHGGRVWAEAETDRGATFYFTLGGWDHSESKAIAATANSGGRI